MTENGPTARTFAEIDHVDSRQRCRRCGSQGDHRLSVIVTKLKPGQRNPVGTAASRSWRLCESCAVEAFEKFTGALR